MLKKKKKSLKEYIFYALQLWFNNLIALDLANLAMVYVDSWKIIFFLIKQMVAIFGISFQMQRPIQSQSKSTQSMPNVLYFLYDNRLVSQKFDKKNVAESVGFLFLNMAARTTNNYCGCTTTWRSLRAIPILLFSVPSMS